MPRQIKKWDYLLAVIQFSQELPFLGLGGFGLQGYDPVSALTLRLKQDFVSEVEAPSETESCGQQVPRIGSSKTYPNNAIILSVSILKRTLIPGNPDTNP